MDERRREAEHLDEQRFVKRHWPESPSSDWLSLSDRPVRRSGLLREVVHIVLETSSENEGPGTQLQNQFVYCEPTVVIRTEIVRRGHSREEIQFDVPVAVLKILDILLLALDVRLVLDRREQEMVVKVWGPPLPE